MTLFYTAPDNPRPCGGIKTRYRHVDLLNRNGIPACILHEKPGFRCSWFENSTPVISAPELKHASPDDILTLPEVHGPHAHKIAGGLLRKVIFNQGIFNTFNGYSIQRDDLTTPYRSNEVIAVIVNSAYAHDYIRHTFPGKPTYRVHLAVDHHLFAPLPKKRQIAFLPGKNVHDVLQVINILKFREALTNWALCPLKDLTEPEMAERLGESAFFLNFTAHEGFGKPPVEALACGCIVVGYDAISGREYMRNELAHPVAHGDVLAFAQTIEILLDQYETAPGSFTRSTQKARQFVIDTYSPEREESELLAAWQSILALPHPFQKP